MLPGNSRKEGHLTSWGRPNVWRGKTGKCSQRTWKRKNIHPPLGMPNSWGLGLAAGFQWGQRVTGEANLWVEHASPEPEPAARWEGPLTRSQALQACQPLWHFQEQKVSAEGRAPPSGSGKARDRPAGPGRQIPALPRLRSGLGLRFVPFRFWCPVGTCLLLPFRGTGLLRAALQGLSNTLSPEAPGCHCSQSTGVCAAT